MLPWYEFDACNESSHANRSQINVDNLINTVSKLFQVDSWILNSLQGLLGLQGGSSPKSPIGQQFSLRPSSGVSLMAAVLPGAPCSKLFSFCIQASHNWLVFQGQHNFVLSAVVQNCKDVWIIVCCARWLDWVVKGHSVLLDQRAKGRLSCVQS